MGGKGCKVSEEVWCPLGGIRLGREGYCSFSKHLSIFKPGTVLGPGAPRSLRHSFALQKISLGGVAKIRTMLNLTS